ncbi:hypothetical protein [Kineothrix sp. MB12-C1]|nr:hypothetical protein [Kineothrix sp. MB12-C1]WMC92247.1 hypothetical protein RBB56_15545 [Kineothrix sp. MB12-C1]
MKKSEISEYDIKVKKRITGAYIGGLIAERYENVFLLRDMK